VAQSGLQVARSQRSLAEPVAVPQRSRYDSAERKQQRTAAGGETSWWLTLFDPLPYFNQVATLLVSAVLYFRVLLLVILNCPMQSRADSE